MAGRTIHHVGLLTCLVLAGCTDEANTSPATSTSSNAIDSAVPTPSSESLSEEASLQLTLNGVLDVLKYSFGDETYDTSYARYPRRQPEGAAVLDTWLRARRLEPRLFAGPDVPPSGPVNRGSTVCLWAEALGKRESVDGVEIVLVPVESPRGITRQPGLGFQLHSYNAVPAKLPARFCGVYTGRTTDNDGTAWKLLGMFQ
jgi:hypothetical protein